MLVIVITVARRVRKR